MKKILSLGFVIVLLLVGVSPTSAMPVHGAVTANESDASYVKSDASYVKGEVIVTFQDDTSQKEIKSVAAKMKAETLEALPNISDKPTYVVDLPKQQSVKEAVDEYEKNPKVESVQPNYLYTLDDHNRTVSSTSSSAAVNDTDLWNLKKLIHTRPGT